MSVASPLYAAYRSPRYQRQEFIKEIEALTGNRLLVYFCDETRAISQADVAPLQELLLDCPRDANNESRVDLLIQSSGGNIDAAEKLVYMIRSHSTHFRVIVAERAKSAATMIAMASDEILMSSTSELGPIDPQIPFLNAGGNYVYRPARSFLDGLETIKNEVTANTINGINPPLNNAYYPLLSQIDPALIDLCEKAIQRSQQFAEKWLKKHMLSHDFLKASQVAAQLVNVQKYNSHGMVIDHQEIQAMGVNATFFPDDDPFWAKLWRLFVAYQVASEHESFTRIFEGNRVSLSF